MIPSGRDLPCTAALLPSLGKGVDAIQECPDRRTRSSDARGHNAWRIVRDVAILSTTTQWWIRSHTGHENLPYASSMGVNHTFFTGDIAPRRGIYQSTCACRTALTISSGQRLPGCISCADDVSWRLAQAIDAKPLKQRTISETRMKATDAPARERLPSASGEN